MSYVALLALGIIVLMASLVFLAKSRRSAGPAGVATSPVSGEATPREPPRSKPRVNRLRVLAGCVMLLLALMLFVSAWTVHNAQSGGMAAPAPNAAPAPPWSASAREATTVPIDQQPLPRGWILGLPSGPGKPEYDLPIVFTLDLPPPAPDDIAAATPRSADQSTPANQKAESTSASPSPMGGSTAKPPTPAAEPSVNDLFNSILSGLSKLREKTERPVSPEKGSDSPRPVAPPAR